MPFTYTVDPNLRLVLTTGTGIISDEDSQQLSAMQRSDPHVHAAMRELLDLRQIERLSITPAWLRAARKLINNMPMNMRTPWRSWSALTWHLDSPECTRLLTDEHFQVRVFRDYAEACEWLGIPG